MNVYCKKSLWAAASAALFVASPALADPLGDVALGTSVFIDQVIITVNGNAYTGRGYVVPKPSGGLTLVIDGSDFGVTGLPPITLSPSTSDENLTWSFDQSFSPAIPLPNGLQIDWMQGQIVTRATPVPGGATLTSGGVPCPYDVHLGDIPGSWGTAHVSWGGGLIGQDVSVTLNSLSAYAGVPPPTLAAMHIWTPGMLRSGTTTRVLVGQVDLAGLAPTNGAWVDLDSSDPSDVPLRGVTVPAGEASARFRVAIPPGFAGAVTVNAAVGGVSLSQILNVLPESACSQTGVPMPAATLFPVPIVSPCVACGSFLSRNDEAALTGVVSGQALYLASGAAPVALSPLLLGGQVTSARLNDLGQIAGVAADPKGNSYGYVLAALDRSVKPTLFTDFTPLALNDAGTAVGEVAGNGGPVAAYFNGQAVVEVPVGDWSYAIGVDDGGDVAGNYVQGTQMGAFFWQKSKAVDVGSLGGTITLASAMSSSGQMTGYATDKTGAAHPFFFDPAGGGLVDLGLLKGFSGAYGVGVSSAGWVVGTAYTSKNTSHGFLYTPSLGMVDLNTIVSPKAGIVVVAALAVDDVGNIVVTGQSGGQTGPFLLAN